MGTIKTLSALLPLLPPILPALSAWRQVLTNSASLPVAAVTNIRQT
jgi:hypothetical protein